MIRLLTLLTVEERGCVESVVGGTSSVGEVRPVLEVMVVALALPKPSFHRDGFFVGADGGEVGVVVVVVGLGVVEVVVEFELRRLMINGWGIAYIEAGSKGCVRRDDEVVEVLTEDCLLSSRARDCEATASVFRVSSWGLVVETLPLPLRAPLLRRLVVEADRDDSSCGGSRSSSTSS